jgi:hypothetical protein
MTDIQETSKPSTFKEWKEDLEKRLALHLFLYPEKEEKLLPSGKIITVEQMIDGSDYGWVVRLNGSPVSFHHGAGAHRRAIKRANELANEV